MTTSLADQLESTRALLGLLDLPETAPLRQDIIALGEAAADPTYRIAVFGPFNYGKSTLLNALLGQKTLPIGLIPTTGAAIAVRYGETLSSQITLTSGQVLTAEGTQLLQDYAVLDEQRQMRSDVAAVTVMCPHPLLKLGVEFLDLPGTNDRDAQEALVRDRLLTADLIVQVLDGRQLMTLGEREQLRDWLGDRGIRTVVFVVNFMNLLEPADQATLQKRLRLVAQSFRADLPPGVSNLYRVDALPALRARLKGDTAAAQTTGLAAFEAAIQQIVSTRVTTEQHWQNRLQALWPGLQQAAVTKQAELQAQLQAIDAKHQERRKLLNRAQSLIQAGFQKAVQGLEDWLVLADLRSRYETELAAAIAQDQFESWSNQSFRPTVEQHRAQLHHWLQEAGKFCLQSEPPRELAIAFPPQLSAPPFSRSLLDEYIKTENIRALLDSPLGDRLRQQTQRFFELPSPKRSTDYQQLCQTLAQNYLMRFSQDALASLENYCQRTQSLFQFPAPTLPQEREAIAAHLQLLTQQLEQTQTQNMG
ncbi:MAG: dynamin family protein [Cyanobacteria bacterium P01_G01_bin.54]